MAPYVRLLGRPAVEHEGSQVEPPAGKTWALAFYLAYQGVWVERSDLLLTFWPDSTEQKARRNLRQLLTTIRRLGNTEGLRFEDSRVRWDPLTDVAQFRRALSRRNWSEAVRLYRGDLLEDFELSGVPEFTSWVQMERHVLHRAWREAVLEFCSHLEATRRHRASAQLLQRLQASEPLDEEVLRRLLVALNASGDRSAAIAAYEAHRAGLQREMQMRPEPDTERLADEIRSGELGDSRGSGSWGEMIFEEGETAPQPTPKQPMELTPLLGRRDELERIGRLISRSDCRLVTIVGLGGMGKSRLAMEASRRLSHEFRHGVSFAALADRSDREEAAEAICQALGYVPYGSDAPSLQLLDYLQDRELLLVLDNLEQLPERRELVLSLLSRAPHLKVLATSRVRLNARSEWVIDLGGLECPSDGSGREEILHYPAASLFVQAASRARSVFRPEDSEADAICRICRLLGGMPLALELAAARTRVQSPGEIAHELQEQLLSLEAHGEEIPERQRSLRVVLEQSWGLLTEPERQALLKLTVFAGSFDSQASREVAAVPPPRLMALMNKSFVRAGPNYRFELHPVTFAFLLEKRAMAEQRQELAEIERRHASYYLAVLRDRGSQFKGPRGAAALDAVEADLPNLEAAWQRAVRDEREELLSDALDALAWFYILRGRSSSGAALLEPAVRSADEGTPLHARLLGYAGFLLGRTGRREGIDCLQQALASAEQRGALEEQARWMRGLGVLHSELEPPDLELASAMFQKALRRYRKLGDAEGVAMMLNNLAVTTDDADAAQDLLMHGISIGKEAGDPHSLGLTLGNLAQMHLFVKGNYDAALYAADESLSQLEATGHTTALPQAYRVRCRALLAKSDHAGAEESFAKLAGLAESLEGAGAGRTRAALASLRARRAFLQGDRGEARTLAETARTLAQEVGAWELSCEADELEARVALDEGRWEDAGTYAGRAHRRLLQPVAPNPHEHTHQRITLLQLLGRHHLLGGAIPEALSRFAEAFALVDERMHLPAALDLLAGLAQVRLQLGSPDEARPALTLATAHASSMTETRLAARQLLESIDPRTAQAPLPGPPSLDSVLAVQRSWLEEMLA